MKQKNKKEINDESRGTYNEDNQVRFERSILSSSLCDYSNSYILVKGTITVASATAAAQNNNNKEVILKNCASFTNCINRRNNTQVDDAYDIDVVMLMYNLIGYIDNYSETSGILWPCCRDEPTLAAKGDIVNFNADNDTTSSFKIKEDIAGQTGNNDTKNVEIKVLLKYLSNFWGTLEMPVINREINLDLNWSEKCVIVAATVGNQGATFSITDTKLYLPVVTLSTQDNAKLLEQLESDFKRTINWNKYQSKKSTERKNQYLNYLIDPSFRGANRLFAYHLKMKNNELVTKDIIFQL